MNKCIFLMLLAAITLLLFAAPGYCLYPANVDPEQMKALVQIQREKDRRNREANKAKEEQARQLREQKAETEKDPAKSAAKDRAKDISGPQQTPGEAVKSESFKRLEPPRRVQEEKQAVVQDKPAQTQKTDAPAPRRPNFKLFLIILTGIIAGIWIYKKKAG
ncbi:MAG: hypothetical protein KKF93_02165 [Candidatus Omnitrophica bacterium]|nr:hypothetical protein [Candidatus Omnitrophota bacterium]